MPDIEEPNQPEPRKWCCCMQVFAVVMLKALRSLNANVFWMRLTSLQISAGHWTFVRQI